MARVFRFACERALPACIPPYGFVRDGYDPRSLPRAHCLQYILPVRPRLCAVRTLWKKDSSSERIRFCAGCEVFSSCIRGQGASASGCGVVKKGLKKAVGST